ncbi:MAG: IS1182 family transposase [Proteobacteria bacterium]|nr:IS1182 family transposase [Pseudomonadota bacterium]
MHYKKPKNRNEIVLFPQVDLWVGQDSSVRLIDSIIDKLISKNPDQFEWKGKHKKGCTSYSPATMVKLLIYCYFNWIPGSRRMEKETHRNLELLWLIGDLHPDHWTICQFRRENKEIIKTVAIEFRKFLKATNYIEGKTVAIDGSKMKAYASPDMFTEQKIKNRLENIEDQLDKFLRNIDEIDNLDEQVERGDKEKQELIERINKLENKKAKLEGYQKQLQKSGKKYLSPNDPDANLMKSRDGKKVCYNIQSGIDAKHKMVAMAEVTTEQADIDLLEECHTKLDNQLDIEPSELLADKGYANTDQLKNIEEKSKTRCYVPLQDIRSKINDEQNGISFTHNEDDSGLTCSQGKKLRLISRNYKQRNRIYNVYKGNHCSDCNIKSQCTKSKTGRTVKENINNWWIKEYKQRLATLKAKKLVRQRKAIVEHPFGTIKLFMGKHCFLLTKKHKVQVEIDIYSTVYNMKRLLNISSFKQIMNQIENYNWKIA